MAHIPTGAPKDSVATNAASARPSDINENTVLREAKVVSRWGRARNAVADRKNPKNMKDARASGSEILAQSRSFPRVRCETEAARSMNTEIDAALIKIATATELRWDGGGGSA